MERQKMRRETRRRYRNNLRRAMAVSEYLRLSATEQHCQATQFVIALEEKYPEKSNVTKTPEFRNWKKEQIMNCQKETVPTAQISEDNTPQKEMILHIPLISVKNTSTNPKETPTNPKETPAVLDLSGEDQLVSIFDEIPDDIMNQMMQEIQADPQLDAIMNDFEFGVHEEVLDQGIVPENICQELDAGIEIDDRLEQEIDRLLCL